MSICLSESQQQNNIKSKNPYSLVPNPRLEQVLISSKLNKLGLRDCCYAINRFFCISSFFGLIGPSYTSSTAFPVVRLHPSEQSCLRVFLGPLLTGLGPTQEKKVWHQKKKQAPRIVFRFESILWNTLFLWLWQEPKERQSCASVRDINGPKGLSQAWEGFSNFLVVIKTSAQ